MTTDKYFQLNIVRCHFEHINKERNDHFLKKKLFILKTNSFILNMYLLNFNLITIVIESEVSDNTGFQYSTIQIVLILDKPLWSLVLSLYIHYMCICLCNINSAISFSIWSYMLTYNYVRYCIIRIKLKFI